MRTRPLVACGTVVLFAACLLAAGPPSAPEDSGEGPDADLLRQAGVKTDPAGLLAFFRQRAPSPGERKEFADLIAQLGGGDFAAREKAEARLRAAPAAVPQLRQATGARNPETARRARRILARLAKGADPEVAEAAARLLARLKPPGDIRALLAYLPYAPDARVEGIVRSALGRLHRHRDRAAPAVLKVLADAEPARRAAAYALGQWDGAAPRRDLARLLKDPVLKVRFHAALALVKTGDKTAVPRLIDLLDEAPLSLAWQAERLLQRVAGPTAPPVALQGTAVSRRKVRLAWEGWWKANQVRLRLSARELKDRSFPLILVTDLDQGRVIALDPSWKELWAVEDLRGPTDVQFLPSGRILIAENHGGRVTERTRAGRVLWEKKTRSYPLSCWRLDSGNTFIATRDELLEVTPEGRTAWSHKWPESSGEIWCARPLRGGGIVVLAQDRHLVYFTPAGREVRRVELDEPAGRWSQITVLAGGEVLLAGYDNDFEAAQLDRDGRKVWSYDGRKGCDPEQFKAIGAARLPNGHTLLTAVRNELVLEVDRAGKVVREHRVEGCPWHVQVVLP